MRKIKSSTMKVQNIILNVLLVQNGQDKSTRYIKAFTGSCYQLAEVTQADEFNLTMVQQLSPDIIIVDVASPTSMILSELSILALNMPKPVVMFADDQNDSIINALVKAGVSAFIAGEFNPNRLFSILNVAAARFTEYQKLKRELQTTKEKLNHQKTVEQAKLWLMENKNYSENEAYHCLRKIAMDNSQKVEDVAKNILALANIDRGVVAI
ncbi:ANTAR domain-containing response regulator [Thalassotalea insulae]|nr:ANTAR domain-containing protein [Thalassotalea insulae]